MTVIEVSYVSGDGIVLYFRNDTSPEITLQNIVW